MAGEWLVATPLALRGTAECVSGLRDAIEQVVRACPRLVLLAGELGSGRRGVAASLSERLPGRTRVRREAGTCTGTNGEELVRAARSLGADSCQIWLVRCPHEPGDGCPGDVHGPIGADVWCLCVPPLRRRLEDVPALAVNLAAEFAVLHDAAPPRLTDCATGALQAHDWPGNVSELRSVVQQAFIMSDGEPIDAAAIRRAIAATSPGPEEPDVW